MNKQGSYKLGLFLVTASAIFWSTAGVFAHIIETDTPTMLFWRGLFGALALFLYMVYEEGAGVFGRLRRLDRVGWLYAVVGAISMQLFITAFRYTSVAHVAVIYAVVPFVAGGLGWLFMRETPSRTAVVSSLFALGGVGIMVGFGEGEGHISGDLMALGTTFCMASIMVLGRKYRHIDLLAAACVSTLISALISLPFAGAVPGMDEMIKIAAFAILNMAAGFILFAFGSRMLPPMETALIGSLDAPLAPVWMWLLFNEVPVQATLLGGGIVFFAVMAHFWLQTRSMSAAKSASLSP